MKSVVVGTAGHVDHGKSALVRALTGTDPDRLKEEKARGITIDLGFAHLRFGDITFAFVDVPGHERFVRNMLAGAGGIDLVMLVVAATESVMAQTREHFEICRLLQVPAGIVVLTKADLAGAEALDVARLEVCDLIAGSFLAGAPIVAASSVTGQGLDEVRAALAVTASAVRGRPSNGPTRLPIDRVFSMKGFGTVVTGTLVSGRVAVDDDLVIEPGGRPVKVRGVQVHGIRRPEAAAGERSAVNLAGVDVGQIARGHALVARDAFATTSIVDATIETLADAPPLKHGARVRFHQGTVEVLGRAAIIGPAPEEGTPLVVPPASRAFVRIRLEQPAILTRGDRYILRGCSPPRTIAGGRILDPTPPRAAIRTRAALARCQRLDLHPVDSEDAQLAAAAVMVEDAGRAGLPSRALVYRGGADPSIVHSQIGRLASAHQAVRVREILVTPAVLGDLKAAVVAALEEHHRGVPLSQGLPREEVRERLFGRGHPAVFEHVVEELAAAGVVVARDRLRLASHRIELSAEEERAREAIEEALRRAALSPPDVAAVASSVGISPKVADRVVKLLQRQKRIVKIGDLFFHEDAIATLKESVAALKAGSVNAGIDVATFKTRFGVTRKFAIPLLEYLDRERVTRRVGAVRMIL